jgi:hypothetical protein
VSRQMTNSERLVFLPMVFGTILWGIGLVMQLALLQFLGACLLLPLVLVAVLGCVDAVLQLSKWLLRRK